MKKMFLIKRIDTILKCETINCDKIAKYNIIYYSDISKFVCEVHARDIQINLALRRCKYCEHLRSENDHYICNVIRHILIEQDDTIIELPIDCNLGPRIGEIWK